MYFQLDKIILVIVLVIGGLMVVDGLLGGSILLAYGNPFGLIGMIPETVIGGLIVFFTWRMMRRNSLA